MKVNLTLGEKLSDERKSIGKTIAQVCEEISKKYGYRIATGKLTEMEGDKDTDFGYKSILYLAKYYNISADYLLGLSGVKSTNKDIIAVCKHTGLSEEALFWLEKDIKPDESAIRPLNILLSEGYAKYLLKNIDEYCLYRLINERFKQICLKNFLAENKIELPEKEVEERSVRIFEVEKLWTDIREMWDKRIEFEHYLTEIELKYFGTLFTTDLDYHEYKVTKNFKDILDGLFFSYYDFSDLETNIDNYYGDLFSITEKVNISEFYYDLKRNNSEFLPTDYEKSPH